MLPTTIIVPLDGSALAETALEPGRDLADQLDADLLLVRATWHRPSDQEERYLDGVADHLGYGRTSTQAVHGFAAPAITAVVEETPGSMLCLSTRGHTGLVGELLLGSVASELLEGSSGPTVLVGPSCAPSRLGREAKGPIVFCFDASIAARSLEPLVVGLAKELERTIELVTVLHRDGEFLGGVSSKAVDLAAEQFMDRLPLRGVVGERRTVNRIEPARALLRAADEAEACLLIAGATADRSSQGLARISRAVLGSTAERLVRRASVPVLVAPPRA